MTTQEKDELRAAAFFLGKCAACYALIFVATVVITVLASN